MGATPTVSPTRNLHLEVSSVSLGCSIAHVQVEDVGLFLGGEGQKLSLRN
jgi:hypothetical protein